LLSLDYGEQEHLYTLQEVALTQVTTHLLALTLEQVNAHLTNLVALAYDAILVRTFDGHITFWNQGAKQLYGWTSKQALGQIPHQLLHTRFPISGD
jgi:PAS domain-containing protein